MLADLHIPTPTIDGPATTHKRGRVVASHAGDLPSASQHLCRSRKPAQPGRDQCAQAGSPASRRRAALRRPPRHARAGPGCGREALNPMSSSCLLHPGVPEADPIPAVRSSIQRKNATGHGTSGGATQSTGARAGQRAGGCRGTRQRTGMIHGADLSRIPPRIQGPRRPRQPPRLLLRSGLLTACALAGEKGGWLSWRHQE